MVWVLVVTAMVVAAVSAWIAWRLSAEERRRSAARVAALGATLDEADARFDSGRESVAVQNLFATERPGVPARALIKLAVGAAGAIAIIVIIAMSGDARSTSQPARPQAAAALELLSMRHVQQQDQLVVTGLVRNSGSAMSNDVSAVVLAFDGKGGLLASSQAELAFGTLGAGEESPFEVRVSVSEPVARYRVSFRTDAGSLRHVDRRADTLRVALPGRQS